MAIDRDAAGGARARRLLGQRGEVEQQVPVRELRRAIRAGCLPAGHPHQGLGHVPGFRRPLHGGRGSVSHPHTVAAGFVRPRAFRRRAVLAALCALALAGPAWSGTPTEDLKRQTDRVLDVLRSPTLTPAARRAAVRDLAAESFDLGETARRALGAHWQALTSGERDEFVRVFRELLEQTYIAR